MSQKIAIAVVHGIGKANPSFADPSHADFISGMAPRLRKAFAKALGQPFEQVGNDLEIEAVYWAPVLQNRQDELDHRLGIQENLGQAFGMRDFVFHSLADSIGYQITPGSRDIYDDIHQVFADAIARLAERTGPHAPLCIISHSMGSAVASNYVWDLQGKKAQVQLGTTPMDQGETLALFYTFGSQIAFWSLRYRDFGSPIAVPSPSLKTHYPKITGGEWINFYDRDDLLGYPLENINDRYATMVTDQAVNVGNLATRWNLFSHNAYWQDGEVVDRIAQGLARVWQGANG